MWQVIKQQKIKPKSFTCNAISIQSHLVFTLRHHFFFSCLAWPSLQEGVLREIAHPVTFSCPLNSLYSCLFKTVFWTLFVFCLASLVLLLSLLNKVSLLVCLFYYCSFFIVFFFSSFYWTVNHTKSTITILRTL